MFGGNNVRAEALESRVLVTEDQKFAKIAKKYNIESSSVNEVI